MMVLSHKKTLLVLFLWCELIGIEKIASIKPNKLSDCKRCKVLTDSFNHWLDKTSRGKYEGGDAAWEEAKLKSYSRSEIRLVEIQENMCSELNAYKDPCYVLAEEAEQILETWWFHEDPQSANLFKWLCIDNLQHCCPKNHFGDACTICPIDENNKVCGGHGNCDGDGTRKGNGTCLCKKGYTGSLCDKCAEDFYSSESGSCQLCHKSCRGCRGEGASSCEACSPGWKLESGVCVDLDECSLSTCKSNEYCINTEGSYTCNMCHLTCMSCLGVGAYNCTSCETSKVLWFGSCIDNELRQNIIMGTYKKFMMYIGLLAITLLIFRTSKSLASLVILIIAVFIYFSEKHQRVPTMDVLIHLLYNSN